MAANPQSQHRCVF
ncbi:hypothetical protein MIMGU_mgv1a0058601mg, partial [Erythranthe guttata]